MGTGEEERGKDGGEEKQRQISERELWRSNGGGEDVNVCSYEADTEDEVALKYSTCPPNGQHCILFAHVIL